MPSSAKTEKRTRSQAIEKEGKSRALFFGGGNPDGWGSQSHAYWGEAYSLLEKPNGGGFVDGGQGKKGGIF